MIEGVELVKGNVLAHRDVADEPTVTRLGQCRELIDTILKQTTKDCQQNFLL